jgi:hypothetical protein
MFMKMRVIKKMMIAAMALVIAHPAAAQYEKARGTAGDTTDVAKTLRAAADAMGMVRWSDIGAGKVVLPAVDVITTMEFWGSGTSTGPGQATPSKVDYHASLSYNPPSMRVEITRESPAQHSIQVVREKYAWNESEIGAGLVPGKGTATPAMAAVDERLLQIWILPYGIVKAAIAAGDKTRVSNGNGLTIVTFPLTGKLAGVTAKATLDAKNFITKVETQTDNPAMGDLVTEVDYSDYADHGEILTDVKSPGHIVEKKAGRSVLDIQIKMWDANNPYLVFPVPEAVKKAGA